MIRVIVASLAVFALCVGFTPVEAKPRHVVDDRPAIEYVPLIWSSKDVEEAIAFADDKEFGDANGAACWKIWRPAAVIMEKHRLPKVPRTAADVQAFRMVRLQLNKLQGKAECKWLSDQPAFQALASPFDAVVSAAPKQRGLMELVRPN